MGSVKRIRGIGPGIFNEIKQTLKVYDETLDGIFSRRDEASAVVCWKIVIARPQADGNLQILYERDCQPGTPIPADGSYVLLPDTPQKYVVKSIYYTFTNNQVVVLVSED